MASGQKLCSNPDCIDPSTNERTKMANARKTCEVCKVKQQVRSAKQAELAPMYAMQSSSQRRHKRPRPVPSAPAPGASGAQLAAPHQQLAVQPPVHQEEAQELEGGLGEGLEAGQYIADPEQDMQQPQLAPQILGGSQSRRQAPRSRRRAAEAEASGTAEEQYIALLKHDDARFILAGMHGEHGGVYCFCVSTMKLSRDLRAGPDAPTQVGVAVVSY
jgi:hypothetical protein